MADAANANTQPHSDEAEQAVLGSVLQDNAQWGAVAPLLRPGCWYHPDHAAIWQTIGRLIQANKRADPVTVQAAGEHDLGYLTALVASVVTPRNAQAYAEIVHERALRRHLIRLAQDLQDDAMRALSSALPAAALIDRSVAALLKLQQGTLQGEPRDLPDLAVEFLDDLQQRADGHTDAMQTGLADLDRLTSEGGRPGELWVLGARPSMGKTAMMLTICRNVGRSNRVLVLTQEDSLLMLTARHVAAAGRVNLADLRNPQAAPASMWAGVAEGIDELRPLLISMDDQPALTMADVRRKCQQSIARHGPLRLLMVDYLQLMVGEGDNRNQILGAIAYGLQTLAKELGCWVVLLSQLTREADKRPGPPQMSDLRDSGDIEGAAHLIGLLHREARRKPTEANKHWAQLHVCKQKNGPTGTVDLFFDGATQRFENWHGPAPFGRED